jgi:hypothetical protein
LGAQGIKDAREEFLDNQRLARVREAGNFRQADDIEDRMASRRMLRDAGFDELKLNRSMAQMNAPDRKEYQKRLGKIEKMIGNRIEARNEFRKVERVAQTEERKAELVLKGKEFETEALVAQHNANATIAEERGRLKEAEEHRSRAEREQKELESLREREEKRLADHQKELAEQAVRHLGFSNEGSFTGFLQSANFIARNPEDYTEGFSAFVAEGMQNTSFKSDIGALSRGDHLAKIYNEGKPLTGEAALETMYLDHLDKRRESSTDRVLRQQIADEMSAMRDMKRRRVQRSDRRLQTFGA